MKVLFVVNPISGGVDKEPFLSEAKSYCQKYGIDCHVFKTTGNKDEKQLLEVLGEYAPDRVLSVGGDGTTLFTAKALLGKHYPIGIIPLGSANGMATELYVNPEPMKALTDALLSHLITGVDLLKINDEHYCIHLGDVGVNAQIVASYEQDANRGMATYAKYFVDELTRMEPFGVTVHANDSTYHEEICMIGICNARKYGTGVPLNVTGNPMDGKFELVLINQLNAGSLIKAGLAKFDETYFNFQDGRMLVTEYAEIEFDTPRLLQLDGEVIGTFKHLKVEILPSAVQLISHRGNLNLQ
ncbi:diacylglycerol kinase [Reichenbachiella sp. 5M10]|uniref:diacylglycerol/lipid kinase family protein n=1 Tax=Reichenbachiella sp. 5M10 TaxID=1889772 RepID=UPI000C14D38E|nr:diacylglycerol kinase family protein [Reichenbachiella sp. 5M10]PIB35353.1 diacylglycerol kinase [Reichenbachiella sp. 5M10]